MTGSRLPSPLIRCQDASLQALAKIGVNRERWFEMAEALGTRWFIDLEDARDLTCSPQDFGHARKVHS